MYPKKNIVSYLKMLAKPWKLYSDKWTQTDNQHTKHRKQATVIKGQQK